MSTLALVVAAAVGLAQPAAPSTSPLPDIARKLPSRWSQPESAHAAKAPDQPAAAEADKWVDAFPHVRVNRAQKTVEFDGVVAWDFHDADAPRTELELLVCLPMRDKEHESLVLSKAKGAHVHAALLMAGLEPGTPGKIDFGNGNALFVKRIAPTGPAVSVSFTYTKNGKDVTDQALTWVIDEKEPARDERIMVNPVSLPPPSTRTPAQDLVFAGSRVGSMKNEQGEKVNVYNADELGCLIGLCTFGGETIALTEVVSPDSGLDAPRFIANSKAIPPAATRVRVRIRPSETGVASDKKAVSEPEKAAPTRP